MISHAWRKQSHLTKQILEIFMTLFQTLQYLMSDSDRLNYIFAIRRGQVAYKCKITKKNANGLKQEIPRKEQNKNNLNLRVE